MKIIFDCGVEPAMADDAARSLEAGERLFNEGEPQTLADGARTRSVGVQVDSDSAPSFRYPTRFGTIDLPSHASVA